MILRPFCILILPVLLSSSILFSFCLAQDKTDSIAALKSKALRIYLDCTGCDFDFVRSEITFVNYVRERQEAQVHILVTTQPTAGGGSEYIITFIGQQEFAGFEDTLGFFSKQSDTQKIIRNELVRVLKLGLMRYVSKTPLAEQISISFQLSTQPTVVVDKWKNWVFSANLNSWFSGQKTTNFISLYTALSANRVTPDLKIRLSFDLNYSENNFEIAGQTISSFFRSKEFRSLVVFSLNDHWSFGPSNSLFSSTFSNTSFSIRTAPAIEYNFFPYSLSTRRQLRIQYSLGYNYVDYLEETIFDKTLDRLYNEVLSITLELKETWGSISTTLEGSHYFYDFKKNRVLLYGDLSLRLFKGFSLLISGNGSMIHDQLSLPKRGATQEEILLQRREIATQFQYFGSIGISYTFGSIYSNVVNPRFGY